MAEGVAEAVTRVLYSGYIGEGEEVSAFEADLARYFETPQVSALNSGTSALHLAYHMVIDGAQDAEIISTPITCTATNMPIVLNRARIVWADVDPVTGSIDPSEVEALITPRTRAIAMVHWGGNPCDIGRILEIAGRRGIKVVEDAAHALGATYAGQPIGRHSDFVIFSFQAIKHVTSVDGGCLVCRDSKDHARGKLLRWYGIDRAEVMPTDLRCEIDVVEAGYKFHMNNVSAAIGRENFKHFDWIKSRHQDNATFYNAAFAGTNTVAVVPTEKQATSAAWLYTIHIENRDEVMARLIADGIGASKVHARNDTLAVFEPFRRPLPHAASFDRTHLCIPVGWWVTPADRERVAEAVIKHAR